MKNKKTTLNIMGIMTVSVLIMFIVEFYIVPGYIVKSILKVTLFLIVPLIYVGVDKSINLLDYFKIYSRKQFTSSIILGLSVYMLIIGVYFILTTYIDLSQIRELLYKSQDINRNNFFYVAVYISFLNSLLEEFFFRGFLFLSLNKTTTKPVAYLVSAMAFGIYHIGIMVDWFNIAIFLLALTALFAAGLIFNYINEKNKNIYNSWLVHMFANFALNTIGFMMFGII
ncbi:CPBP family glutamic-type intramembrane protease [Jeotgalibaca sp. MA1X17-3]|uniref:CPBP family intramembrane glutamic endopeptidase n=1 Tax=Jeotgalibaca sp. MA1X17-3 TaxID=2908211 RepID=UPI001F2E5A1F|nr:CPBP family intramembrane glutamic endopeptidase [Jeotgalibaca sp. MA1X17-3]UJF15417.1 CPBP family glutamic-type intramembrane protease [Jeotgalibaca sp. MA1X17-3]